MKPKAPVLCFAALAVAWLTPPHAAAQAPPAAPKRAARGRAGVRWMTT